MRMTTLVLTLMALLFSAMPAAAQTWEVDKPHSHIYFDARHTFVTVRGQFTAFTGSATFDPSDLTGGRLDFTVETASIDTGITRRDDHLRSDDFFSAKTFPAMRFTTTAIRRLTDRNYEIEGDLTVRDVTKRIKAPMTFFGVRENPLKKGQIVAGIEVAFPIDRLEYGVGTGKFYQMGVVDKRVDVLVALEVLRDK